MSKVHPEENNNINNGISDSNVNLSSELATESNVDNKSKHYLDVVQNFANEKGTFGPANIENSYDSIKTISNLTNMV